MLRHGGESSADTARIMADLDDAFEQVVPLDQPITVIRGIGSVTDIAGEPPADGFVFRDHGFVSTTISDHIAASFSSGYDTATLKITIPAGAKVLSLIPPAPPAFKSRHPEENEILLPRDTVFEIVTDTKINSNREIEINVII
ncbi:hypothetical protein ThrDRAFT_01098 [Frankia casuarinae]|nr:ADP-ribosyltransferase [Frankia sp. CeD]EYT93128.1 hypothetical protein ThrDRAFT_01098 [Frankia casuarinae]KEZ35978.1 ADP-ribosyltransferase exoenzyme [Frankia sp. CeD]